MKENFPKNKKVSDCSETKFLFNCQTQKLQFLNTLVEDDTISQYTCTLTLFLTQLTQFLQHADACEKTTKNSCFSKFVTIHMAPHNSAFVLKYSSSTQYFLLYFCCKLVLEVFWLYSERNVPRTARKPPRPTYSTNTRVSTRFRTPVICPCAKLKGSYICTCPFFKKAVNLSCICDCI